MSRILATCASLALVVGASASATAADVQRTPSPPPPATVFVPPPADWSGHYAGLLAGYGWGTGTIDNDGWIGGAFVGTNIQVRPHLVVGVEGDIAATSKSGSLGGTTVKNPWNGTVRGRIGYATQNWLIYGTGGVAFGAVRATTGGVTETDNRVGWTAGAGVERKITEKVTARLEYRHTDLGTASFGSNPSIRAKSDDVLVGIAFRF
jgi:outer membrane immunogenic protein